MTAGLDTVSIIKIISLLAEECLSSFGKSNASQARCNPRGSAIVITFTLVPSLFIGQR
jgi:hypothetical protein